MIFINLIIYTPLSLYLLSKRELHDFIDRNHFRDGLYLKRNRSSKQFITMLYQFNSLSINFVLYHAPKRGNHQYSVRVRKILLCLPVGLYPE